MSGRAVLAQARLETRLLVRSSESLLITLGIPLGVLVFFSLHRRLREFALGRLEPRLGVR